ncbi:MAG: sugar phosphate isomerase/epimerase [Chloroflexota bacterium]|nr:sugar phosphate isomerase/epimerase [Chloroflexota bacterium]
MKLCYALRRGVFYPSAGDGFGEMPPRAERRHYLPVVREMGFAAVEVPVEEDSNEQSAHELAAELHDAGLDIGCVRGGGALAHPLVGEKSRGRLEAAIRYAGWVGASVVNTAMVSPPTTHPDAPGFGRQGERVSQGASRSASEADFLRTAEHLQKTGRLAAEVGVKISIEVHQGSIADNSAATLHLLDLIAQDGVTNVGANPDLGNIYWQYESPEERAEAAIVALAPRSVYWHCKNLKRIHIPEHHRAYFQRVPLPDGDLDYRFAIAAMLDAGYDGYLAIEGAREGDQLSQDRRGVDYVCGLMRELGGA